MIEKEFLKLDHVGIAVPDLNVALASYQTNFGVVPLLTETLPSQGTTLAFLDLPGGTIELLAPLSPETVIARFLAKRGPGLHHVCYEVTDIEASLKRLAAKGITLIDSTPRHGARGSRIAFLHPRSCGGVLTELCDYPTAG